MGFINDDALSGIAGADSPPPQVLTDEGSVISSSPHTVTDRAGNTSAPSNIVTVKIDKTAPIVTVTGVSDGASHTLGSIPTAACSTTDVLSGVATQATLSVTGGNPDGTWIFTATCSGATDNAGNSGSNSVTYTVIAAADACTTTALRDDFNRANGSLGSNWAGLTNQSFYKLANSRVDVQLGGPVVWKPTTFGVNQALFRQPDRVRPVRRTLVVEETCPQTEILPLRDALLKKSYKPCILYHLDRCALTPSSCCRTYSVSQTLYWPCPAPQSY